MRCRGLWGGSLLHHKPEHLDVRAGLRTVGVASVDFTAQLGVRLSDLFGGHPRCDRECDGAVVVAVGTRMCIMLIAYVAGDRG